MGASDSPSGKRFADGSRTTALLSSQDGKSVASGLVSTLSIVYIQYVVCNYLEPYPRQ